MPTRTQHGGSEATTPTESLLTCRDRAGGWGTGDITHRQPAVVNRPHQGRGTWGDAHSALLHTWRTSWRRKDPPRGQIGAGGRAGSTLRHSIHSPISSQPLGLRKSTSLPPGLGSYSQAKDPRAPGAYWASPCRRCCRRPLGYVAGRRAGAHASPAAADRAVPAGHGCTCPGH